MEFLGINLIGTKNVPKIPPHFIGKKRTLITIVIYRIKANN